MDPFKNHPSPFIQPVWRGVVEHIIDGSTVVILLDVGFHYMKQLTTSLYNYYTITGETQTDQAAHLKEVAQSQLTALILNKSVLVVTYPDSKDPERWQVSLFYQVPTKYDQIYWRSVEEHLVNAGAGWWTNPEIPVPSLGSE